MVGSRQPDAKPTPSRTNSRRLLFLPPANEVWGKVIFLHLFVILFTGGGSTQAGAAPRPRYQVHPRAGTPPRTRYTPGQVRYTPLGTRYTPWAGTPPLGRYCPRQVHPLGPGTPPGRYTPQEQVHPPQNSACCEIRATSGRYASYWNAFLFAYHCGHSS